MATCKYCRQGMDWGHLKGQWVPLIPLGEEGTLPRTHVDENGELRTLHNVICTGRGGSVRIEPLARPVAAHLCQHMSHPSMWVKREPIFGPPKPRKQRKMK